MWKLSLSTILVAIFTFSIGPISGQHFVVNQPAGQLGPDAGLFGSDPEAEMRVGLGANLGGYFDSTELSTSEILSLKAERVRAYYRSTVRKFRSCISAGFDVFENILTHTIFNGSYINATWFCSIIAALSIVCCGVVPAFIIPFEIGSQLHHQGRAKDTLNYLLSFAVGSLLGDVFLHILPETWGHKDFSPVCSGLWIIAGLLSCFLVEKCCAKTEDSQHQITAIMNLIANLVDNFTHGLAVGGSFLVNIRFGCLTTFAILLHEIPHEISDFAILLRADFNRWSAVKAQLLTACGGILGAWVALMGSTEGWSTGWILPFTAGGFLNIALVQILPELMQETDPKENLKHILLVVGGITVMSVLNCVVHV